MLRLRLLPCAVVDGLIGIDAAHIQWQSHGGPDAVPNGLALLRPPSPPAGPRRHQPSVRSCGCGWRGPWRALRPGACSRSLTVRKSGCRSTGSSIPTWAPALASGRGLQGPGVTAVGPEGGSLSSLRERRQGAYKAGRLGVKAAWGAWRCRGGAHPQVNPRSPPGAGHRDHR